MPQQTLYSPVVTSCDTERCVCSNCGSEYEECDGVHIDHEDICPDCATELTDTCSYCGDVIYSNNNAGDDNITLCDRCFENHYTTCNSCNAVIRIDDSYNTEDYNEGSYCYSCNMAHQSKRRFIHEYSYKPEPIFYPEYNKEGLYMGIELEIDGGGEDKHNAEKILRVANENQTYIYLKRDGSLVDGFEIVSHPATLDYHVNQIPWKAICEKCRALHYTSHQSMTCGLHIHVSRSALGSTLYEQEATIARILYFMESHFNEVLTFSRRTKSQLAQWAARYGYKERPMDILDHAKHSSDLGRYTAVNLLNQETIEFRVFRGTLKPTSVIAAMQLVYEICIAAISMTDDGFKSMSWNNFVLRIKDRPELIEYLKAKQLYVNEPVFAEEEV